MRVINIYSGRSLGKRRQARTSDVYGHAGVLEQARRGRVEGRRLTGVRLHVLHEVAVELELNAAGSARVGL